MPIERFSGDHHFLSNFAASEVTLDGVKYRTVEHAYQAAKTDDAEARSKIRKAQRANEAKALGQRVKLRPGWDGKKIGVMLDLLRQKFGHPDLRKLLLATGDEQLIEGNTWRDSFWGVYQGKGQNHLGRLLMRVRTELKEQTRSDENRL